jgi:hypothetical protein
MITTPSASYRLKEIRGKQIILQASNGALRVINSSGLLVGRPTSDGVTLATAQGAYTVSPDDFRRIRPLLEANS